MRRYIDLHAHSNISDGSLSPRGLVRQAAEAGLTTLALTDHDSVCGLEPAADEAAKLGLELVRGCELSTRTEYGQVDILALWLPEDSDSCMRYFEMRLDEMREARHERNLRILDKLALLGLPINADDLPPDGCHSLGRPHIAAEMLRLGYVKTRSEAFERYLGAGKPAYVPKEIVSPEEAIELINSTAAISVLAHPLLIKAPGEWLASFAARLKEAGLDAIEAYHSEHSNSGVRTILELASRLRLLVSGGSDFHGDSKPHIRLGCGRGTLRVPETVLDQLQALHEKKLRGHCG